MAKKIQKKRKALGRDFTKTYVANKTNAAPNKNFQEIPVENIEVNPFQPRIDFDEDAISELAESINIQGIIQPITVRRLAEDSFQLISGERRFQASKRAGLDKIPAYIRTADDQQMLEMSLIENIQRENLNAIEVALSYQRLMDEIGLKQEDLGDRVGKKRSTVNNYLRLLRLPPEIQNGVREQKISFGHARALINVENPDLQLSIYRSIVDQGLSVRKTEELVRQAGEPKVEKREKEDNTQTPEIVKLQSSLSSFFGTKIQVKSDVKNKGNITIPFVSLDDLNRILEILEVDV